MIRSKKFYTIGSIVSMAIMFTALLIGFFPDSYHSGSYYGYSYGYYISFAEYGITAYSLLCASVIIYISFGIVAVALYNKRIAAINIINLILTSLTYMYAMIISFVAIECDNVIFAVFMLFGAVAIAFPFHLVVEIFALIAQKYKNAPQQQQPAYAPQQQPYVPQQQQVYAQQPVYAASSAPKAVSVNNDAINALKQLKDLYDAGVITEEEYNAKRQQYVSKI